MQTTKLYKCDPDKNVECEKTHCFINNGPCEMTNSKEYEMENEIRYYLNQIKACMEPSDDCPEVFEPAYIVTAVKLPTGAIELAVNTSNIKEKIDYILDAYDDEMRLKTNTDICMQNIMIV